MSSAQASEVSLVAWHDAECGAYRDDLDAWRALAATGNGAVLDLGCGTGRVALELAAAGTAVVGVDREPALVDELNRRARERALPARGVAADVREIDLARLRSPRPFALAIAPMQLAQLMSGRDERVALLRAARRCLALRGTLALAIVEGVPAGAGMPAGAGVAAGPDALERDGRTYSSLPLELAVADERLVVRRLRQTLDEDGDLTERVHEEELAVLDAAGLEREAAREGFTAARRLAVPSSASHVGSTIVCLEAA